MSRIANEQVDHSSPRWANLVTVVQRIDAELARARTLDDADVRVAHLCRLAPAGTSEVNEFAGRLW